MTLQEIEIVASAARTADGDSGPKDTQPGTDVLALLVDVTVASGGDATLDLSVEWSPDGGTTWFEAEPADTLAQITEAKKVVKRFDPKAGTYRVVWTIAGTTPSFTFSVLESPQI